MACFNHCVLFVGADFCFREGVKIACLPVVVGDLCLGRRAVVRSSEVDEKVRAVAAWLMAVAGSVPSMGSAGRLLVLARAAWTGSHWQG